MKNLQHIFHLGLKELVSLARDPVLLVLILYSFTLSVYTPSKSAVMDVVNASVAIVDEHMARELWPGQDAVGRRIHIGGIDDTKAPWITIVGVVGRVKQYTLDSDSRIAFYLPHTQYPTRAMNVVVRSATDPAAMASPSE